MTASWVDGDPPTATILNAPNLLTVTFTSYTSDPGSPGTAEWYYNTTLKRFRYYTGSTWIDVH